MPLNVAEMVPVFVTLAALKDTMPTLPEPEASRWYRSWLRWR